MPVKSDMPTNMPKANGTSLNTKSTTVPNQKAVSPSQCACVIPQPPATFSADMANNNPVLNGNGSPNFGHKLSYANIVSTPRHKERNESHNPTIITFGQSPIEEEKKEETIPVVTTQSKQSNIQIGIL